MLRSDYYADITIFNPETVIDVATFADPNRVSRGIEYVIVNGTIAIDRGTITGKLGGRPLRGPAYINKGIAPDGLRPKGRLQGVITTPDGWPLPRTNVRLLDSAGTVIAESRNGRDGRFDLVFASPCRKCRLLVTRMGFTPAERSVDYNGSNPLWFGFALTAERKH
jgi:hypothetical protein